jgi:hypothetical protein
MSSKEHERKLAAAIKKMGTSLATHPQSTFKLAGAGSRTLEEFKVQRAAETLSRLAKPAPTRAERCEMNKNTAQVTKLPVRKAG